MAHLFEVQEEFPTRYSQVLFQEHNIYPHIGFQQGSGYPHRHYQVSQVFSTHNQTYAVEVVVVSEQVEVVPAT